MKKVAAIQTCNGPHVPSFHTFSFCQRASALDHVPPPNQTTKTMTQLCQRNLK